jgi:exodeoxyribonuclease V beta subunit
LTRAVHRCYLVVGSYTARSRTSTTESHRGPLNWLVAGQGHTPEAWAKSKLSVTEVADAWDALAEKAAPHVGLAPLPLTAAVPLQPLRPAPDALAALVAPLHLPAGWWIGSYSSLTHGAHHEGAAVDHDLRVPAANAVGSAAAATGDDILPLPATAIDDDDDDDILRFPRGPLAGECMHAVFERIDFTQPEGWPAAVEAALRMRPQTAPDADAAARLPKMLAHMLDDVLHTPLPGGFRLADVPRGRRLVELEFSLPSKHLRAASLAAVLRDNGYPAPPLGFGTLEGYLRGFIDLVFEHAGRFHILDWKSNHLGDTRAHYGSAPMARAMDEHGYHLQALLYTVAVHRYLQQRLPNYRYDEHFGGVMYLFVRGVRPGWTTADGAPAGVHAHRPALQVVAQISALMEPMREPA